MPAGRHHGCVALGVQPGQGLVQRRAGLVVPAGDHQVPGEIVEAQTDLPAIAYPADDLDLLRGQPGRFGRVVVLYGDGQHAHRPRGQCRLVERAG